MRIWKKIRKLHFTGYCMLQVALLSLVPLQTACAAVANEVTLSVEQVVSKPTGSAADTFTYTLTPHQPDNPMPDSSSGGIYTFTISGTDIADIDPILFSAPGTFSYEIKQTVVSVRTGYTYDMQVYTVWVYAKNTSGGLKTEVVVIKENGYKALAISFENTYTTPAGDDIDTTNYAKVAKTGDDARPELYQAILFIGGGLLIVFVLFLRKRYLNEGEEG